MEEQLQELCERIQARFPQARVSLDMFGRTGAILAVITDQALFEMQWGDQEGFGVTHVTEDKYWTRGSDAGFDNLTQAEEYLVAKLTAMT